MSPPERRPAPGDEPEADQLNTSAIDGDFDDKANRSGGPGTDGPGDTFAAVRAYAARRGCTCRPDVTYRPSGMVDVAHDADCPLVDAGETVLIRTIDGGAVDATWAVDLAIASDTIVIGVAEAVVVVPDGHDVPPMVAEFFEVRQATRNGRVARVYVAPDAAAAREAGLT